MTAKDFLSQAFKLNEQIEAKQIQIQQLRDMQYNISNTLSDLKVQTCPSLDKMGETTVRLLDLVDEYMKDIARLLALKSQIKGLIDKVENKTYRILLENRHINFMKWEDIASALNYDIRWIFKLYSKALQTIESHTIDMI